MSENANSPGVLYVRLGLTETTLLFYYWLQNVRRITERIFNENIGSQHGLTNWLYTTSGFYDSTIKGNYFNFNAETCLTSATYNTYMTGLINLIKNTHLTLCWHNLPSTMLSYRKEFEGYISTITKSYSTCNISTATIYTLIANKRILIVNPMSSLMKQQYEAGNIKHIYATFPELISLQTYENPYTFFNNGPDGSILETADKICAEISHKQFDIALVSCGAYSSLIGNYIREKLGKDVIVIGGDLLSMFGIKTARNRNGTFNDYWISVPEHLKPTDYMKIEDGCYW